MLELGREGEFILLEGFPKKDLRDLVFSTIVGAAAEFDLDLSDRDGAWSAVRGLLQLPAQEPLVDEFRCHSESFASEKKKGEGRLYITPYYVGWTEGRGQARIFQIGTFSNSGGFYSVQYRLRRASATRRHPFDEGDARLDSVRPA